MKKTSRRKFGSQLAGAMAALPIAALVTSAQDKPQDKDKEKEKEKEKKKDRPLADDPPILVGGGGGSRLDRSGSTYIWVRNTFASGPLQPLPANAQDPQYDIPDFNLDYLKANYNCYEILNLELGKYETHDGSEEGKPHPVKQRRKHCTRFYR